MEKYPSPEDIAEMKARGFCPTTIRDAEARGRRWHRAEEICRMIEFAFAEVKLGNGVGLVEGQGLDDYADEETCARYRADDEKDAWHRIPTERLNQFHSSLSFFDAEGMRFHLPAFLSAELRGDFWMGTAFTLTYSVTHDDRDAKRFSLLNNVQRAAVRSFLLFLLDDPESEFDRQDILKALDEYWIEPNTPATSP